MRVKRIVAHTTGGRTRDDPPPHRHYSPRSSSPCAILAGAVARQLIVMSATQPIERDICEGMIVILRPDTCRNPMFAGCLMTITECKSWGAQGYVQALGENGEPGGQAYYRAKFEEMDITKGINPWRVS